jgi:DNA modification methylase
MARPSAQIAKLSALTDVSIARPILDSINWTFSTPFSVGRSGMHLFDCRRHHWYPATFIPEIPYTLIEVLSKPGAVIYDPFGGIGTSVFQSLLLGREPYATELGRVAVDFIQSMWTLFQGQSDLSKMLSDFEKMKSRYNEKVDYAKALAKSTVRVELLRPWFSPQTFNQLMYLALIEHKKRHPESKAAMRIAFSATLKAACAQDRGWGCIADNMLPRPVQLKKPRNALDQFGRKLASLLKDIGDVRQALPSRTLQFLSAINVDSRVQRGDLRTSQLVPNAGVDLVVTSPPYPNMTDYALSQRLSYYWLGSDPTSDLVEEIGARRKRNVSTALQKYLTEMKDVMKLISIKLRSGGYACFVMPEFESDKHNNNERRRVVQECLAFLPANGLVLEQELQRILPSRRRHHNQKWTTLERELIFVYRKS